MWFYLLCLIVVGYWAVRFLRMLKISNLHDRHVFITGCDRGFGRRLAVKLDKMGLHVFAGCMDEKSIAELTDECSSRFKALKVDVTRSTDLKQAARSVKKSLGDKALWGLVNNAGVSDSSLPFEWLNKDDYKRVLDINLFGVIDTTTHFFPLIRKANEGRIVNIASQYGRFAPFAAPYTVSKFGVEGFSDGLSKEAAFFNVSVHTLEPGFFKTSILEGREEDLRNRWKMLDQATKSVYGDEYLESNIKVLEHMRDVLSSDDLDQVVDAYTHALLARYPKERYIVGSEAKYFFIPLSYLPIFLQIRIVDYFSKRMGTPLPRPAGGVKKS